MLGCRFFKSTCLHCNSAFTFALLLLLLLLLGVRLPRSSCAGAPHVQQTTGPWVCSSLRCWWGTRPSRASQVGPAAVFQTNQQGNNYTASRLYWQPVTITFFDPPVSSRVHSAACMCSACLPSLLLVLQAHQVSRNG
jgi:hypothetical protein